MVQSCGTFVKGHRTALQVSPQANERRVNRRCRHLSNLSNLSNLVLLRSQDLYKRKPVRRIKEDSKDLSNTL